MSIFSNKNNVITYTVNKAGTSSLCVSVQNGEVIINAPWYATNMQIQKVVEEKKQWILSKISEYESLKNLKQNYIKMKEVKVLGKNYNLIIKYKAVVKPSINFEKNEVKVILPNSFKKIENSEIITTIVNKMYDKIAEKEIERAMEKTRIMLDIAPEDYKIERMNNPLILAKCNNNVITINPDIVMYSEEAIEYIVLHEFCHLKYKNHTQAFYKMLKTYMPNYEKISKELSGIAY